MRHPVSVPYGIKPGYQDVRQRRDARTCKAIVSRSQVNRTQLPLPANDSKVKLNLAPGIQPKEHSCPCFEVTRVYYFSSLSRVC